MFLQDCSEGEVCSIVIVGQDPVAFQTACVGDDGTFTQGSKETCSAADDARCTPALLCYEPTATCLFNCRVSDALGCTSGEACVAHLPEFGLGICQPDC